MSEYVQGSKELELLRKLINIAANSVGIKTLVVKEPLRDFRLRPQLHLLISSPFGGFKSTLLSEILSAYPGKIFTHLTFPALIGSIDRSTKQIIPAAAWECRNKLMLLDEYTSTRAGLVSEALLQLLENQYYSRKIATYSADLIEEDEDLYFKVKSGNIEVKTRFSAIFATMKNIEKARECTFRALLSRTIPIRYEMSLDEINQVLDGKLIFKPEKYNVSSETIIEAEDYLYIRNVINQEIKKQKLNKVERILARVIGDCCRVFAVLGRHEDSLYKDILTLKYTYTL